MSTIELRGINQRGKNRIREHGPVFNLARRGHFKGRAAVLVECQRCPWWGWLDDAEASPMVQGVRL